MHYPPTLKLFAGELKRIRTNAGLSQQALGEAVQYSASLVAMVETCRRPPGLDFTKRCDDTLPTDGLLGRIRDAITEETLLPWFRDWVLFEQDAVALRSYQSMVIPGLLQTEEYARAVFVGASRFVANEVDAQVAARMERQSAMTREHPPRFVAVLDENVLRRPVGGPQVMRDQMARLVELGELPHVHLHVVPIDLGAYAGFNGPFVIATLPGGDDVGYIDSQLLGHVVQRTEDVLSLRHSWEALRAEAMPHRQSIDMITEAAQSWS